MLGNLYIIRNSINNKVYIGKTYDEINWRFKRHIAEHRTKGRPLYKAMLKHGHDKFYVQLLGTYPEHQLEIEEQNAIAHFNSFGATGYNATRGGDGNTYLKVSEQEIINSYSKTQNMAQTARDLEICEESVAKRLRPIDTAKGKPVYVPELNETFRNTTHLAKSLFEADCAPRAKTWETVRRNLQQAIQKNKPYLGFTFTAPSSSG